jgi:hypothetical protein
MMNKAQEWEGWRDINEVCVARYCDTAAETRIVEEEGMAIARDLPIHAFPHQQINKQQRNCWKRCFP